jgi:lipoyl-dependent peroxiredoxin
MQRKASARWQGTAKEGSGTLSVASGTLKETPFSFVARFGDGKGTNPEELIAAAHAGCFTMALSAQLETAGKKAESIQTEAVVTMDKTDAGFTITAVHLKVRAKVPGAAPPDFQAAADAAKKGCPVSRVLNAQITMEAKLEGWT